VRYANVQRQIEKRKEESEKWSRSGKWKRAKRQGARERTHESCYRALKAHRHDNTATPGSRGHGNAVSSTSRAVQVDATQGKTVELRV